MSVDIFEKIRKLKERRGAETSDYSYGDGECCESHYQSADDSQKQQEHKKRTRKLSPIEKVLSRLEMVSEASNGWMARCPAHPDHTPSLSIKIGEDGRVLLHCLAGCDTGDVLDAMGLEWKDLFLEKPEFMSGEYYGMPGSSRQWEKRNAPKEEDSVLLQSTYFKILNMKGLTTIEHYKQMGEATLDALHLRGKFFFHLDSKDFLHAMYFDGKKRLLRLIASDEFQAWLAEYAGLSRVEKAYQYILKAIENEALAGDTTGIIPASYWHATKEGIYLSNGDGQMVRITAGKVEIVDNGTDDVLFAGGRTLKPWNLTTPQDPFVTCRLFRECSTSQNGLELMRVYLLSLPTSQRCKPLVVFTGTVGSGKTRLAVGIYELLGISPRIIALLESGQDDFWTQLDAGGLVCFDNADTRIRWLPDALASASTDGVHEKRQLYTDGTIIRQHARAWAIITSANPTFASDAGLADRLLVVRMDRRTQDTAESELADEITQYRDAGLSWMADTLSKALASPAVTHNNLNRRHPDFATFAVRIGQVLGEEEAVVAALQSAENDKSTFNLENDEIGKAIVDLLATLKMFRGTAGDLLDALKKADAYFDANWTTVRLGKRIGKLWSHLEAVLSAKQEKGSGRVVTYTFTQSEDSED